MKQKFLLASILLFGAVSASFAQSDDSDEENVVVLHIILLMNISGSVVRRMT